MPSVHEILTERFYQWEQRGRGWQVFPEPVHPEPPFRPFDGYCFPETPVIDDGRRPTFLSSFVRKLSHKLSTEPPPAPPVIEEEEDPDPESLIRESLVELQTSLPAKLDISQEAFEQFLSGLALCREPIAFEVLGVPNRVTLQFASHPADAPTLRRQLQAYFPEATFQPREGGLANEWNACEGEDAWAVEFGLSREFMFPLRSGKLDPFIGLVGALSELQQYELGLFQVIFQATRHPWAENIIRSVTHADGRPFFVNMPELTDAANEKVSRPLYAAIVRILVSAENRDRTLQMACDLAGSLRVFANPQGNELIPLRNDNYPYEDHLADVLLRQSRRTGMLLSSDELVGFVHLPSSTVRSPKLVRQTVRTKSAPKAVLNSNGLVLGYNVHAGESVAVALSREQRVRHTHIIGVSGTGKSTLLFNLIRQDIENGEGVAVLDPHGDLVDRILGVIPLERIDDVVLVDPSDEEYAVGFNILSAHSDLERELLASDLVSIFQRLSTSWGDQMGSVLQSAIAAFLHSTRGGTLADLRRFLIEPSFRTGFLKTVRDPNVLYYWQKGFPHLSGNKSIGPVLTRLQLFLAKKPISHMVCQSENRLDFAHIMDTSKIFLAKLPEGLLGRDNSYQLGALFVSKIQQTVMSRQAQQLAARKDFWMYIDEFANFITPSMAEILSGARKYRLGLTLAHHELHQLQADRAVASAVMSHPFTRIVFRVGDEDAPKLSEGFSYFEARDLQNLEVGQAVVRVERSDYDFNLTVRLPDASSPHDAVERRQAVIDASRKKYAARRADVEATLFKEFGIEGTSVTSTSVEPQKTRPASPRTEETAPPPPLPPEPNEPAVSPSPMSTAKELGIGGEQHHAIRDRVQSAAQEAGFVVSTEKYTHDGKKIDLHLKRGDVVIACEISVTSPIDKEVGNVRKCLKEGISQIVMLSHDQRHLQKIAAAVAGSLGPEASKHVMFLHPDEFIAQLRTLAPVAPAASAPQETNRGYPIRRVHVEMAPEELKAREDAAFKLVREAMRKGPKQPPR